jgi:hypothetical protein
MEENTSPSNGGGNKPGGIMIVVIIVISVMLGTASCSGGGSGSSGSHSHSTSTNTCTSCGRSWEAGDSGGNFMSIARTSMCKNCYNNFKWAQEQLGK